jgi:hypothetical protein
MFTPHQHSANMSWSRPFVVGFILLMVFLSMSNDGPSNATTENLNASKSTAEISDNDLTQNKGVKEQIIYDLSLSNEKLEQEIKKYRQYVLDLRRAVRSQPGCSLEDSSILTLYPELHNDIDEDGSDNEEGKGGSSSEKSSKEAAAAVAVEELDEQEQENESTKNDGSRSSKHVDSASVRLQNGRLSKENNTLSNLP